MATGIILLYIASYTVVAYSSYKLGHICGRIAQVKQDTRILEEMTIDLLDKLKQQHEKMEQASKEDKGSTAKSRNKRKEGGKHTSTINDQRL